MSKTKEWYIELMESGALDIEFDNSFITYQEEHEKTEKEIKLHEESNNGQQSADKKGL
jgi:hypothetical protein